MRLIYLLFALIASTVLFFYLYTNFSETVNAPGANITGVNETLNNIKPVAGNQTDRKTSSSVPSGFQGPTGQPHVIGPTGPPPNY